MENKFEAEKLEAQKRFDSLPENLKKEMLADKNVQLISSIAQDYKIAENDVKKIAMLVGEVFLGYIKPEEVASELNKYFGVDLQKSNFIEIELKQKLFNPLKADLDKIYNPPKLEAEEDTQETGPAVINLEKEAASSFLPLREISRSETKIPLQKPSEIITEKKPEFKTPIKQVNFPAQSPKTETPTSEGPFVIHTQSQPTKPLTPQFPKETPSLNLKVDESIIQKAPTIKPISVRLESQQPTTATPKFQMPISPKPLTENKESTVKTEPTKPSPMPATSPEIQKPISQLQEKPISQLASTPIKPEQPKIEIPIKKAENISTSAPTLKQIAEKKEDVASLYQVPEPPKVVHYSAFKTPLTPAGTPKKQEQNKEKEYINLSTFTKVSGNTVDLRKSDNK